MKSILLSVLSLAVCGICGALGAWLLLSPLELARVPFALATAFLAVILAVAMFAGLIALGDKLGILKKAKG
jgi:hypothetical protein